MVEYVKVEQDGRVAVVTIDNPPVNALSAAAARGARGRDRPARRATTSTRAIVLRGGGERAFVAGADIKEFPALRERRRRPRAARRAGSRSSAARMDAGRTPVVAAIHGYCLGGGLELAMACDIRIAAENAQLGQPEIKLGLIPGGGGTQRLPRLVGHGRALLPQPDRRPDRRGTQAYDWGLVERVVPRDGAAGRGARDRADASRALAGRDGRDQGARGARRATCRSPRACGARPRASSAASAARTAPRA